MKASEEQAVKIVMEIGKFEHGTFTPRGKEGQPDAAETWVRLVGRPVPEQGSEKMDARWLRTISYGPVADALKGKINEVTFDGDKVGSLRLIVELEGEWKTRVQNDKEVRAFVVSKFDLRTGPSVELSRLRRDADVKLAEAAATAEAGDLSSAYRALETFVAGIALRGPIVGNEAQVSIQDGPEERALKAFAKADGKELSTARKEEPAAVAETPTQVDTGTGPIEAPLDEPTPKEAAPAEETKVVEEAPEPAVEEKAAEPAPAPTKIPPPRAPMAPRMPMPRRPPPPPPSGMKPR